MAGNRYLPSCDSPLGRKSVNDFWNDALGAIMWARSAASALTMTAAQSTGAVRELAEAHALIERHRTLNAFCRYQRSETDVLN